MIFDPTPKRTIQLLEALRDHPFLSCEQIELHLSWRKRTTQWHLEKLVKAKWARIVNGRQPDVAARSLYVLTREGLDQLAWNKGMVLASYVEIYRYHAARLERLILVLDRVYLVRSFLMQLKNAGWAWSVADWDVEVELKFATARYDLTVACHGIARLKDAEGCWLTLVVEFDTDRAPVKSQRARLARLVEGTRDSRFFNSEETAFPILVILAANRDRFDEYISLLYHLAGVEYELPRTFLTTRDWWLHSNRDPTALIWKTEQVDSDWVSLLNNIQGGSQHPANYLPWERLPRMRRFSESAIEIKPLETGKTIERKRPHLAALTLTLHALDKTLLALIGDHPLLDAVEMANIMQMPVRSIRRGIKRLHRWLLIEARTRPQRLQKARRQSRAERQRAKAHCYFLSEKGLWLVAAWAGFGTSIENYARDRGWRRRFWELVHNWDHTRIENAIYIQLLRAARNRGNQIRSWYSELESRIYFDTSDHHHSGRPYYHTRHTRKRKDVSNPNPYGPYGIEMGVSNRKEFSRVLAHRGQQLKSFLPDGLGMYDTDEQSYNIAIEVDRTRANYEKLWQKFNYYLRSIDEQAQSSWRILILTTGWQRAANIANLVVRRALAGSSFEDYRHLRGERLIARLKQEAMLDVALRDLLPVYVTTVDALRERGIASLIWIDARDAMNGMSNRLRYCMECFKPKANRKSEKG